MSDVIDIARGIMAILQPETGNRASGIATIFSESGNVEVPRNSFIVPILSGRHRPDLVFKIGEGPGTAGSWTITTSGVDVDVFSNIGGKRHNLPSGTPFVFDPPLSGIRSAASKSDMQNGTDPSGFGGIMSMAMYEQFDGPSQSLDLARSPINSFPSVLIAWNGTEPADGSATSQTSQRTRTGSSGALYHELFDILVITIRKESEHIRRQEGLDILDRISARLIYRRGVDGGQPVSNPGGLQIRNRFRDNGPQDIYQKFYVYGIRLAAMVSYTQIDERSPAQWLLAKFDVLKPQDPALPNQGDYTVVDDAEVDMYRP